MDPGEGEREWSKCGVCAGSPTWDVNVRMNHNRRQRKSPGGASSSDLISAQLGFSTGCGCDLRRSGTARVAAHDARDAGGRERRERTDGFKNFQEKKKKK